MRIIKFRIMEMLATLNNRRHLLPVIIVGVPQFFLLPFCAERSEQEAVLCFAYTDRYFTREPRSLLYFLLLVCLRVVHAKLPTLRLILGVLVAKPFVARKSPGIE